MVFYPAYCMCITFTLSFSVLSESQKFWIKIFLNLNTLSPLLRCDFYYLLNEISKIAKNKQVLSQFRKILDLFLLILSIYVSDSIIYTFSLQHQRLSWISLPFANRKGEGRFVRLTAERNC